MGTRTEAGVQAYYQSLFNVPIAAEVSNAFSAVNQLETLPDFVLNHEGTGRNRGVELYLQRFVGEGWSCLLSGSLYDVRYRGSDGVWRDSRYNGRYAANLTLGREWVGQDQGERPRRFGFNAILRLAGGQRAPVIDEAASAVAGTTVFDYNQGFPEQLPTYYRADLRVYYQRNRPRMSSTLALDIQNVTDRANVAYYYYDRLQEKVVTRYQLGVIPVLSYRVNFAGK